VTADGSTVVGRCQNSTCNGRFTAIRWLDDTDVVTLVEFDGGNGRSPLVRRR